MMEYFKLNANDRTGTSELTVMQCHTVQPTHSAQTLQ